MSATSTAVKEQQTALQNAVRKFTSQLSAPVYREQEVKSLTESALLLMRQLPVARNAVLSYFGRRFDDAANRYLQYRVDKISGNLYNSASPAYNEDAAYASLAPISTGFQELITDKSWAPQLSRWAIDLLGHISKKLNSSQAASLTSITTTVEEKLELWMACSATKILIEITSNCFSMLVDTPSSVDSCVESLLDASVRYAPHFDWVVAHLGSCFPMTIIDRILVAGYKDFVTPNPQGNNKFSSVAAILGYLSAQHKNTARKCIVKYFQTVLDQPPPGAATAVTFLLTMASSSAMLVPTITADIGSLLNIQTLNKLTAHYMEGTHDFQSMRHLAVHLLLKLDRSTSSVINLLLDLASDNMDTSCDHEPLRPQVKSAAQLVMGLLCNELMKPTICNRVQSRVRTELPTLKYLVLGYKVILRRLHLTKSDQREAKLVCRLLLGCSFHGGITTAVSILYELLALDRPWALETFRDFMQQLSVRYPDIEEPLCDKIFTSTEVDPTLFKNFVTFMNTKTETANKVAACVACVHMKSLARIVDTCEGCHQAGLGLYTELVNNYCKDNLANIPTCDLLVPWYLQCITVSKSSQARKLEQAIISSCSQSVAILSATLRRILSSVMSKTIQSDKAPVSDGSEVSLIQQNSLLLNRLHLPATKTYMLHTEAIGKGKLNTASNKQALKAATRRHVVLLILRCCEVKSKAYNSTDAKELLSRMILELSVPDVIAAKSLWHDPLTHERELAVRRTTDQYPLIWDLMSYVCSYKPCFVTVSLLVRCHLGTLLTSWGKAIDGTAKSMPKEMEATEKVMRFLVKADLLPASLSSLSELFPHIACYEVRLLLDMIARYLQTSLCQGLSQEPLDADDVKVIQSIIQQNISTLSEISLKFLSIE